MSRVVVPTSSLSFSSNAHFTFSPVSAEVLVSWAAFLFAILLFRRWFFYVYLFSLLWFRWIWFHFIFFFFSSFAHFLYHWGNQPPWKIIHCFAWCLHIAKDFLLSCMNIKYINIFRSLYCVLPLAVILWEFHFSIAHDRRMYTWRRYHYRRLNRWKLILQNANTRLNCVFIYVFFFTTFNTVYGLRENFGIALAIVVRHHLRLHDIRCNYFHFVPHKCHPIKVLPKHSLLAFNKSFGWTHYFAFECWLVAKISDTRSEQEWTYSRV